MICDRDRIDSLGAAVGNKLLSVLATFIVGNGTCALPIDVAPRRMHTAGRRQRGCARATAESDLYPHALMSGRSGNRACRS